MLVWTVTRRLCGPAIVKEVAMSLAQCRECMRAVSADAGACAHCGAPMPLTPLPSRVPPVSSASPFARGPSVRSQASSSEPATTRREPPTRAAASTWRLVWWILAVLGLIVWIGMTARLGSGLMLAPIGVICWAIVVVGVLIVVGALRSFPGVRRIRGRAHGWAVVFAALLVWVVAYVAVPRSPEEQRQQQAREATEATQQRLEAEQQRLQATRRHAAAACHVHIRDSLKVPSSAQFQFPPNVAETESGYVVAGRLEAQNAFGVMLRSNYVCSVDTSGRVLRGSVVE